MEETDDRKEGEQPVSGSVTPGLASRRVVVLGARSQACCHAEAFTGTQRQIGSCWHQVASLIHPSSASAQPPSLSPHVLLNELDLHVGMLPPCSVPRRLYQILCLTLQLLVFILTTILSPKNTTIVFMKRFYFCLQQSSCLIIVMDNKHLDFKDKIFKLEMTPQDLISSNQTHIDTPPPPFLFISPLIPLQPPSFLL